MKLAVVLVLLTLTLAIVVDGRPFSEAIRTRMYDKCMVNAIQTTEDCFAQAEQNGQLEPIKVFDDCTSQETESKAVCEGLWNETK